ncbi:MAG: alpha/beta fold hydrolase [Deltaproteobacteria bacterium]|nr:alpha/beta fold hydrolase [Deltaproteobacteria bacterium]
MLEPSTRRKGLLAMHVPGSMRPGGAPGEGLATTEHFLLSFDGQRLYATEKGTAEGAGVVLCFPPCLNSHEFFDCPVPGYSLMDFLVSTGFRVFAYDPRGFGRSYRPPDGRSITQEVELRDAGAFLDFVLSETGTGAVAMVGFGSGGVAACNLASLRPERVSALALMDFVWLHSQAAHAPPGVREMLLACPDGYLPLSELAGFFEGALRFAEPEVCAWNAAAFRVAPVGPFLKVWNPTPYIPFPGEIRASVLILRGTEAGITSEADSLDFLGRVGGPLRILDVVEGAGPVPSLEARHHRRVLEDIAWFLGRQLPRREEAQ